MNLSNVSKAASFFRERTEVYQKIYTPQEKVKILESLNGKTQKEAEAQLIKISLQPFQNIDKERVVTSDITELRLTFNDETM